MSYQEECEAYAVFGDPERDHWDHEFNAQYDRFDGYREEFHDEVDELPCPDCLEEVCPACQKAREELAKMEAEAKAAKARRAAEADDPTSPNYCPF